VWRHRHQAVTRTHNENAPRLPRGAQFRAIDEALRPGTSRSSRHPAATRPGFVRLGIPVLGFDLTLAGFPHRRTIAGAIGLPRRPTAPLRSAIPKGRQLFLKFCTLGRAGLVMQVLHLTQRTLLLIERQTAEPVKDGTRCNFPWHLHNLAN
jgi:hypothetical protein